MRPRVCRRFTVQDLMILVAATAIGLALAGSLSPGVWSFVTGSTRISDRIKGGIVGLQWMMVPGTAAVLVIRLRQPRPRPRRLARQPGMAACSAATWAASLTGGLGLYWKLMSRSYDIINYSITNYYSVVDAPIVIGVAVASAWLIMAMNGSWRPEPGWIDRSGRLIGIYWLAMIPVCGWILPAF
jgi:hypothetical protein